MAGPGFGNRPKVIIHPYRVQRAGLNHVRPPYLIVVISDGWPSSLIALLGLKLPVASGFFPSPYHRYFKSSTAVLWHPPLDFAP